MCSKPLPSSYSPRRQWLYPIIPAYLEALPASDEAAGAADAAGAEAGAEAAAALSVGW